VIARLLPRLRMPGANWPERWLAALGAVGGVAFAAAASLWIAGIGTHAALLLVAPIGASAVLVFAVPSSPLGQPWSVIGGTIVSTACSVLVAQILGHGALAAGAAVGLSIVAMSLTRCLHPAGGGCALLAVLGGPEIVAHGYAFALVPAGLNAALLVAAGMLFHRFTGHSYPHRPQPTPPQPRLTAEDIDAAIAEAGDTYDISHADLQALLAAAERHAEARRLKS
jgi:CBS domain-containing membrane protein